MSARPDLRALPGGGAGRAQDLLGSAIGTASAWLVEPAAPAPQSFRTTPALSRPVIAVFGLARGCGVTVVARALAAELARRDSTGAAAVHCDARAAGIPLATPAAGQLARALSQLPGTDTRAVGRLCLVGGAEWTALSQTTRELAPLVLDAGSVTLGGAPAALADRVLLVATPAVEPALGGVAVGCLARLGHAPLLVLNRAGPSAGELDAEEPEDRHGGWLARGVHLLPESRMGAQLASGGRETRGELGRAMGELADLCELGA
ncbi:MAG: hypothetical protein M3550_13925 [Actinomycetota bacterium]|nr:hypothetical protein [Actinomycetota bacterium]